MTKLKVFIGYDKREPLAYKVAKYSIFKNSKNPENIEVYPLKQKEMRELGIYSRPIDKQGSTEFTFTRFWTPYLSNYEGWSLFVDCDFLFMGDILEVLKHADPSKAIHVCKHEYSPRPLEVKMDGQKQHIYPRKNWSSCILFNNSHPSLRILNPTTMNNPEKTGAWFHRFEYLSDNEIGDLPLTYNWLDKENGYDYDDLTRYVKETQAEHVEIDGKIHPMVYHYTLGLGPIFAIVDEKYNDKENYPYLWDCLCLDEFLKMAEESEGKSWPQIVEDQRQELRHVGVLK